MDQDSQEVNFPNPLPLHAGLTLLASVPLEWSCCLGFVCVCVLPMTLRNNREGETESLGLCEQAQCCFQLKYPLENLKVFNVIIMENTDYKRK